MSTTSSREPKDTKDPQGHSKGSPGHSKDAPDHGRPQTPADKHGGVVVAGICLGLLALLVAFNMSC